MSCPDAHSATTVNSAVASSANARPARSVFTIISPPYFQLLWKLQSGESERQTKNYPCSKDARRSRKFHHHRVPDSARQYTARLWTVSFVASEKRVSAAAPSSNCPVMYSPTAG